MTHVTQSSPARVKLFLAYAVKFCLPGFPTIDWRLWFSVSCVFRQNVKIQAMWATLVYSLSQWRESRLCRMELHPGHSTDFLKYLRPVVSSFGTGLIPSFVFWKIPSVWLKLFLPSWSLFLSPFLSFLFWSLIHPQSRAGCSMVFVG